ncbi:hypothetical protein D3C77_773710 [compost metagenome]
MRAAYFFAHEPPELVLQDRQVLGQSIHFVQAYDTDLAVFQCNGMRNMDIIKQAIHANDLARQKEAGNLDLAR